MTDQPKWMPSDARIKLTVEGWFSMNETQSERWVRDWVAHRVSLLRAELAALEVKP